MLAWLFCPGHDPRKLEKALAAPVEVVIADWEDAVPYARKDEARRVTREVFEAVGGTKRLFVRVNGARSDMHRSDLLALNGLPISGVMLPKSENPSDFSQLAAIGLPVVALIESALGVENALKIAQAGPLVERLAFGSLDYSADLGGRWTPDGEGFAYARQRVVLAGRAAGKSGSLDGVWPRLGDIEGLRRDAALGRTLGYSGKMIIHPEQIAPVQSAFAPSEAELERARSIVEASRKAELAGESALRLDGEFIDPPVVRWAENVLEQGVRKVTEDT